MLDPLADAALRYQLRLDGVAQDAAARMLRDVQAALNTIAADLLHRGDEESFTVARLQAVRERLTVLRAALAEKIGETLEATREAVIETAPAAVAEGVADLSRIGGVAVAFTEPPIEVLRLATSSPYDRRSWADWGTRLADNAMTAVENELRESMLLGEGIPKAAKRLEAAADLSRTSARKLARTAINDWSNRARMETMKANPRVCPKVRFSAVLDMRVSHICAGLDGREFPVDDANIPRPPRHPNCRSVLLPVTPKWVDLIGDTEKARELDRKTAEFTRPSVMDRRPVSRIPKDERAGKIKPVPASTDFERWFATAPESFQREYLGATRYDAYRRGLPISALASYDKPLTLAQLRALYPKEFAP